jgi:hypothetical protein
MKFLCWRCVINARRTIHDDRLSARNTRGNATPVNFGPFERAYQTLTDKLRPQVFTLGFLR